MWELPQIEVLQLNSKNVGTTTNRSITVKF